MSLFNYNIDFLLKEYKHDKTIKLIYKSKINEPCSYCGYGHHILFFVAFMDEQYGMIDYFDGCLTYDPWCHIITYDSFEKLKEYALTEQVTL